MRRRTFLRNVGAATALLPIGTATAALPSDADALDDALLAVFVERNDQRIAEILKLQVTDTDSPNVGGFPNEYGIFLVGRAGWHANHLVAGLLSPQSAYYRADEVEQRLNLVGDFMLRRQNDDGTIDLRTTNFHSPPDTAFAAEPVAIALAGIRRHAPDSFPHYQKVAGEFLVRGAEALIRGGVHTPNHRWVVCMAMARINQLYPDSRLIKRIDQWLAEGIDMDADGQYTERSTAVYSPHVNRFLITMARLLERPELYAPVRRNLEMTRYLIHPNGELVTEISRRQDQFTRRRPTGYYYGCRYLANLDTNPSYAALARLIENTVGKPQLYDLLPFVLEDPTAGKRLPTSTELPTNYEIDFPNSGLVRIRRGQIDASILSENSTIFTFHKGAAALRSLRLASAFFGKGQFVGSHLEHRDGSYLLTQELTGPYVQPLPDELLPGDGDWFKMPHARRALSEVQRLTSKVTLRESNGSFQIRFDIRGTDHVPVAIELGFDSDGQLRGVVPIEGVADAFLLGASGGSYRVGDAQIDFSHGPSEHRWTELRGAEPKLDAQSVYITGFTPFDFELTIS